MSFNYQSIDLPVAEVIPQIQKELNSSNTLIVKAPPGAGKSTLVPLTLMDADWLKGQKILMLEPRRLAAKTIAMRMADLLGEEVGESVGYRIRFENRVGKETQIEVVTEGILTRMLQQDNGLEGVGLVVFDEFHERSIHADIAMALTREAQKVLRPELRIMVMSATLDMTELAEMLNASTVLSEGRQFPVDVQYAGETEIRMLSELAARLVKNVLSKHEGDALVFLPGEGEIRKCEEILRRTLKGVKIHPLFGQLPPNKQFAAIMPDRDGARKVVLATSIAETSLTIEGIKIVIDSGFARSSRFDPNSGLSRLETVQVSKDSADQRAGRAGRLSAGVCYRMWTKATQSRLKEHTIPEIETADLSSLVLDMAQWGIADPMQLQWLTAPPKGHVAQASQLLHELEALDNNRITEHGKELHRLPTHPRIAHMLIKAKEDGQLELATDVAAIIEERDPLPKEAGIDLNLRVEALRRFRREKIGGRKLARIEKIAEQYRRTFDLKPDNEPHDDFETGLLIAFAYPERIGCARPGNNAQFQMANGRLAMAGHRDDLAHEQWLAIAHVNDREGSGKIFMAAPLNPTDLQPLIQEKEVIKWDTKKGGLIASLDMRIGSIVLKSTPLEDPDDSHLLKAITDAIQKEGRHLLNWTEEVEQWQNRVMCLKKWNPQEGWPDVSTESLLLTNAEWLSPYLNSIKKPEALKKIDLLEILQYSLPTDLQNKLDKLAPQKIEVPSGSKIKLAYPSNGSEPILAVRLQECFGLAETPTINMGKKGILMHLLSPGFKVVQITSDLKSFWENAYFDVKKDMKSRYPKHSWPEDPWTTEAVRGVKRKK
ncbi:MAG: ATP-dependent helicase HrpB [Crocinitomix sp. MedPE-SWsnd]|nr:MAG: ATP-dependent helicase HrpB [Crocinitomix sp. MedPE-SWsnd]